MTDFFDQNTYLVKESSYSTKIPWGENSRTTPQVERGCRLRQLKDKFIFRLRSSNALNLFADFQGSAWYRDSQGLFWWEDAIKPYLSITCKSIQSLNYMHHPQLSSPLFSRLRRPHPAVPTDISHLYQVSSPLSEQSSVPSGNTCQG